MWLSEFFLLDIERVGPLQESYPEWWPNSLRTPSLDDKFVQEMLEAATKDGRVKQGSPDDVYEIQYGLLRRRLDKQACEACNQAVVQRKQAQAADALQNISTAERYRRASVGYGLYLWAAVSLSRPCRPLACPRRMV